MTICLETTQPTKAVSEMENKIISKGLTKISVYKYAPVATGRPIALVPSGRERSWLTVIPISNSARASH